MKRNTSPSPATAAARKPRGRPRSFDRDTALDRAMEVFWRKGYEAASISDLTQAMDINPPSLYAAFGDKEHLYLEAMERYQKVAACPYQEEVTARGAVERLLAHVANELTKPCNPRGCMMVMASTTCSESSPELQNRIAQTRAAAKARLKARIDRGVEEGDVPQGTDTSALADFYATIIKGMSLQARDGASRKSLLATVATAMRAWPEDAKRPARPAKRAVTA